MANNEPHQRSFQALTEIRPGTPVFTSDHKHVGKVHDVVVDANDDALTRVVVNAGPNFPMPGFGAPKLISVSPEGIEEVHHDKILLRCGSAVFENLPIYADWYIGGTPLDLSGGRRATAWKIPHREEAEHEIGFGAGVGRVEPFVHIGDVERVLVDEDLGHVRAIVVRQGHIFGHHVVLPIEYVIEFHDAFLHVRMIDAELEALRPFHEQTDV